LEILPFQLAKKQNFMLLAEAALEILMPMLLPEMMVKEL